MAYDLGLTGRIMDNAIADAAAVVSDDPLSELLLGSGAHLYRMETGSNTIAMTWLAPSTRDVLGIPQLSYARGSRRALG